MTKTVKNNNWAYQFHDKHEKHFIIESLKLTCPRIINYPNSNQESGYLIDAGKDTLTESTTIDKNTEIISFYQCLEMTFNKLNTKLKNVIHLNYFYNVCPIVCSVLHTFIWTHFTFMDNNIQTHYV